jgi:hypothetical protein
MLPDYLEMLIFFDFGRLSAFNELFSLLGSFSIDPPSGLWPGFT